MITTGGGPTRAIGFCTGYDGSSGLALAIARVNWELFSGVT